MYLRGGVWGLCGIFWSQADLCCFLVFCFVLVLFEGGGGIRGAPIFYIGVCGLHSWFIWIMGRILHVSLYPGAPSFLFWGKADLGALFGFISCFWIYDFPYVLVVIAIFTLLCIFTVHYVYFIWCLRFVVSSRLAGECSLLQLIDGFHFL